jgi:SAM-dependent methyltransferase
MVSKFPRFQQVNSSRLYLLEFAKQAASSIPKGATVLDAGAGEAPYRGLFTGAHYESTDFCLSGDKNYGNISFMCDLAHIPMPGSRYDLVLLTQVLEHVPEPGLVLQEIYRVLKPGGALWLTAPLFFEEHEIPHDYFRYTQYGLRHLLLITGFKIEKLTWLEGYCGTFSHQLINAYHSLPLRPRDYGGGLIGFLASISAILLKPAFAGLSILYSLLDARYKYTTRGLCKNYTAVAIKSSSSQDRVVHDVE